MPNADLSSTATIVLVVFLLLRFAEHLLEYGLARANRAYYLDPANRAAAQKLLDIGDDEMAKTLAYTEDKYRFGNVATWITFVVTTAFLAFGGLGAIERAALALVGPYGDLAVGVAFFALLALASGALDLPFAYLRQFRLEAKHGFNRQTVKGFVLDRVKALALLAVLGLPIAALLLWIMRVAGDAWWLWAWGAMTLVSLVAAWLYPTLLAPLFNKFKPLEPGELKVGIDRLADRIGFRAAGIFVMDASTRSSHGNAYFTGVFDKKRIVLFDTLVSSMSAREVVAVLAHELGHFKLHHVRWALIRQTLMSGLTFFLLSRALPLEVFYRAFGLGGVSAYGALVVFGMWFGLVDCVLGPLENALSRRNEFAADAFAVRFGEGGASDLASALRKLRETSHAMPISHPLYSAYHHSHPPLATRLVALQAHG
jgi:STE24 endopeptidase